MVNPVCLVLVFALVQPEISKTSFEACDLNQSKHLRLLYVGQVEIFLTPELPLDRELSLLSTLFVWREWDLMSLTWE